MNSNNTANISTLLRSTLVCVAAAMTTACGSNDQLTGGAGDGPPTQDAAGDDDSAADDGPTIICKPGEVRCVDASTIETCAPTGLKWEPSSCGANQECDDCSNTNGETCVAACAGPCERLDGASTSAGCSFYTAEAPWAGEILVSNPDVERTATVALYVVPRGTNVEELAEGPLELGPGESHTFELAFDESYWDTWDFPSILQSGGVRHVVSDLPVVARHSRFNPGYRSGASLVLPEHMMTGDYVVYGYPPEAYFNSYYDMWIVDPNFFTIIALEHQTTVQWWPTAATAGDGLPLPFVAPGEMGEQLLNRFDTIRVGSSSKLDPPICGHDLSGTVVVADKPIWLESAVLDASVPFCPSEGCENPAYPDAPCFAHRSDFMMEQNLPVEYWGHEYVGPHPPLRGNEDHFWRIYAGADDISVVVEPPQTGTPLNLAKRGDWAELVVPAGTNLQFVADGPIMPVQYVSCSFYSQMERIGGPSMLQMTPPSRFLSRYVFATAQVGEAERRHFVQVIRAADGVDVMLDGDAIVEWESFGDWLIANIEIDEGAHRLDSADPFGANQYGYAVRDFGNYTERPGYANALGLGADPTFIP